MTDLLNNANSQVFALLLVLIGLAVLVWVFYLSYRVISDKMGADKSIYRPYCCYSFCIVGWIFSNAYFQSDLLVIYGKQAALFMAIAANIFCFTAMFFAYIFSCKIVSVLPEKRLTRRQVTIASVLMAHAVVVNAIPGKTVVDVDIYSAGNFVLHFGEYNTSFFLSGPVLALLTFANFLKARRSPQRLRQLKLGYMVSGVTIFMLSSVFILIIIPLIYQDFSLVWLPPALSVIEAFLIGYALLNSRFYSSRYIALSVSSFIINALIYLVPMLAIASKGNSLNILVMLTAWMLISGILYQRSLNAIRQVIKRLLYKKEEYPIDNICSLIGEFRYSSDQAIVKLNQVLNVDHGSIQRADEQPDNVFLNYFRGDRRVLIKEELDYALTHHNKADSAEIEALTEAMDNTGTSLVLPITDHSGHVSHLYMVSKDSSEALFSSEEILGLQALFDEANKWIVTEDKVRKAQVLAGSIAHEIRNPFSKLNYHFERIDADMFGSEPATLEHFASDNMKKLYQELSESKKAVMLGTRFIDAILAEINGNGINSEQFSYYPAKELTIHALSDFCFEQEEHRERVTLQAEHDFMFFGSDTLFSFVIYNLLKNAACYFDSHPDSRIEIRLFRDGEQNRLTVTDTGPGISEANQARIFDDFFTHNKQHGTGLGLSYCKRVMESFGGSIECLSHEGEFTEFTLSFPLVDEHEYSHQLRTTLAGFLDKKHALLAGPEQARQALSGYLLPDFELRLSELSRSFDTERDNADFVLIAGYAFPQAVEIAQKLRDTPAGRFIPILYYQASGATELPEQYSESGLFQGCITGHDKHSFWRSFSRQAKAGALNKPGSVAGKRVLVVDDMQVNRYLVQGYLSREGVEVIQAASGQEAIELVRNSSFDLIFMDIHMPHMDGLQTTREIRRLTPSVPVISLTGEYSPDILQEAEKLMDDHLGKPVTKNQLIAMLLKWSTAAESDSEAAQIGEAATG